MQSPTLLQWELLTKSAFDHIDRSDTAILVSCSPIEVHGPHLPMGADVLESEEIIKRMLGFLPVRHKKRVFLKLPLLYVATDVLPQPGSLHFSSRTIRYVLQDLGSSLAAQGFRKNTYAGNPAEASGEKGQLILNALSEKAATAVSDLLDGALSVSNSHSPLWPYRLILLNPILSRLLDMVLGYKNQIGR